MSLPVISVTDYENCAATALLRRMGDKWTPVIMSLLAVRDHGFNELDRAVEGLSRRMLVRTLRSLERDGLISRTVHPTVPPRMSYALTGLGRSLRASLASFADWAGTHSADIQAAHAHYDAR